MKEKTRELISQLNDKMIELNDVMIELSKQENLFDSNSTLNEQIPTKHIVELGLIRTRDRCAKCNKRMDIPNYHIQLCKSCREIDLDKYTKETLGKSNHSPTALEGGDFSAVNHGDVVQVVSPSRDVEDTLGECGYKNRLKNCK